MIATEFESGDSGNGSGGLPAQRTRKRCSSDLVVQRPGHRVLFVGTAVSSFDCPCITAS
jgi:hypothetical protein